MSFLKKILFPACVIIVCLQSMANANEKTSKTDVKKIEVVIEAFRMSLIDSNKSVFINLFYNETVPWLGVASAQTIPLAPAAK